jgi:hypothetical protein
MSGKVLKMQSSGKWCGCQSSGLRNSIPNVAEKSQNIVVLFVVGER